MFTAQNTPSTGHAESNLGQGSAAQAPLGLQGKSDRSGDILCGRYRLLRMIELSNNMCDLYVAEDLQRRKHCTIKIPRRGADPCLQPRRRFLREIEVLAGLSHPNIIEVQECNEDSDGTPFSVMEPLCGRSLYRALVEEGTFSLGRALDILRPLASALQFANDHGIVHAGLKLGSIFLHEQRRGEGLVTYCEVVKLLDFEFARNLQSRNPDGGAPAHRDILVGVPAFMPPEALVGQGEGVDAKSDQWMLAVLAYRMLSGQLPFSHPDPIMTAALIREREPLRIETLVPSLPARVARAIHTGLAKDKSARHGSVLDLVRAIEGLPSLGTRMPTPAEQDKTLHGFRPDLIALCRAGSSQTRAVPVAIEDGATTERYDSDSLVTRMMEPLPEDLFPFGVQVAPPPRRRKTAWIIGVAVGLAMSGVMWITGDSIARRGPLLSAGTPPLAATEVGTMPLEGDAALDLRLPAAMGAERGQDPTSPTAFELRDGDEGSGEAMSLGWIPVGPALPPLPLPAPQTESPRAPSARGRDAAIHGSAGAKTASAAAVPRARQDLPRMRASDPTPPGSPTQRSVPASAKSNDPQSAKPTDPQSAQPSDSPPSADAPPTPPSRIELLD